MTLVVSIARHVTLPLVALALALIAVASPLTAHAQLRIDITRGVTEPIPIAVLDFVGEDAAAERFGRDVSEVVAADLQRSGLFDPIDRGAFVQTDLTMDSPPRFADWRVINAQALVQGAARTLPDGRLQVDFRLWDIFAGQSMVGLQFATPTSNWRRVAHLVADAVYERLTGESGYFDTRIVYVAESGPFNRRVKRLAIMDQDGENHRFLTDGGDLVLTPRFSPTAQQLTYLSFRGGQPRVYLFDIDTGRQEVVGNFDSMTFAPRFSHDGKQLAMSLATGGNSDIYIYDLRTRATRRLTTNSAIDTSPSFSPDGREIAFNSDRGGSQQLYVMDAGGGNVHRISFDEGRYATPVWSPRGDLIAFTKIEDGRFAIGVMRPDGSGERILATGFHVEGPTWAPNGRVLMYFQKDPATGPGSERRSRLFSIDLTGYNRIEIATPLDASDPAWSPLNP